MKKGNAIGISLFCPSGLRKLLRGRLAAVRVGLAMTGLRALALIAGALCTSGRPLVVAIVSVILRLCCFRHSHVASPLSG
jgi:hypothetical protein